MELIWGVTAYLSFDDCVSVFHALGCELTPRLGKELINCLGLRQDSELSDPKFEKRLKAIQASGLEGEVAIRRACEEEEMERINENKRKVTAIMGLAADTKVAPISRREIIDSLVRKLLDVFSINISFNKLERSGNDYMEHEGFFNGEGFGLIQNVYDGSMYHEGFGSMQSVYDGSPHPNRYRRTRCWVCKERILWAREMVRFRIRPRSKLADWREYNLIEILSARMGHTGDSDLITDIEGYLLVRQVLGAARVECAEGLAHRNDLKEYRWEKRDIPTVPLHPFGRRGLEAYGYPIYFRRIRGSDGVIRCEVPPKRPMVLGNDPRRCPHEHHDLQMLDLLKSTMRSDDFFALMRPYDLYILEKGPHKFCRACLRIGESRGRVCFNAPIEDPDDRRPMEEEGTEEGGNDV